MATEHLTPEAVVTALREEGSVTAASHFLGVNRGTLHSFIDRNRIDTSKGASNATWDGSTGPQVLSEDSAEWGDITGLLQSRGLDPADWRVLKATVNRWQDHEQLKVMLEPLGLIPRPVRSEGWKAPRKAKKRERTGLTFVLSDHHCPYHDEDFHRLSVQMMRDQQPERIVIAGDLIDYASISRHKKRGGEAGLNESLQSAYDVLRSYRDACPNADIVFLDGNHEQRMFDALESRGLISVAQVQRPGDDHTLLSTRHLLRLDELRVEQVFPPDGCSYEHAEYRIPDGPSVRHGWIAGQGAGASALKTLDKLRRNIIVAHTHRSAVTWHTHWVEEKPVRLVAVETGTMARLTEQGMGYSIAPDWQNSLVVVQGQTVDHAVYQDQSLVWRGHEYR